MDAYLDTLPAQDDDNDQFSRDYRRTEAEFHAFDTDAFYRVAGGTP